MALSPATVDTDEINGTAAGRVGGLAHSSSRCPPLATQRPVSAADVAGSGFAERVVAWQRVNGRHELPWQQTRDPYHVWLSEIMLQQTQVRSVIPYYQRFRARFPTLEALAAAPLASVLEAWSGLGYYARARNLHRCAQTIVSRHGGEFPGDPQITARLPGIGRSTAAAIGVFAFGCRAAILDGNVRRVLARCFAVDGSASPAVDRRRLWALAESLLPTTEIEAYSQGLMDLGATLCVHRQPACDRCPLASLCAARQQGRQAALPVPVTRKPLPERRERVIVLTDGRQVLLERRPASGIWGGLLSLPELAGGSVEALAQRNGCRLLVTSELPSIRHRFTHFRLALAVVRADVEIIARSAGEHRWQWLPLERVGEAALPAPIKRLLLSLRPPPAAIARSAMAAADRADH
jgi:A/G-specific adenine glycosylase